MNARIVSGFLPPCLVAVVGLTQNLLAEGDPGLSACSCF
jgi:hypothetical protein